MTALPAISLHQPWATLIATPVPRTCSRDAGHWPTSPAGGIKPTMVKRYETRSRPMPAKYVGQRVAIHAAKRRPNTAAAADVGDYQIQPNGAGTTWSMRHRPTSIQAGFGQNLLGTLYPAEMGARYGYTVLPLGAVVATVVFDASLPIMSDDVVPTTIPDDTMFVCTNGEHVGLWRDTEYELDQSDQLPYGDWTPGRFAWPIRDVAPVDPPIPAVGRQGWFTVEGLPVAPGGAFHLPSR